MKHFVGNEAEFERNSISSVIDERTLRELYLVPFELAVREGGALAIMTGYNRLNGRWLTEQPRLLHRRPARRVGLRGPRHDGLVRHGRQSDLVRGGSRPRDAGPRTGPRAPALAELVAEGPVPRRTSTHAVRRLLGGFDRLGALDGPTPPIDPKDPSPEDLALLRRGAAEAAVLLVNDGILPLDAPALRRVAVLGDHATHPRIHGGGSAQVILRPVTSPLDVLRAALGDRVEVVHQRACEVDRASALLGTGVVPAPDGFTVELYDNADLTGDPGRTWVVDELRLLAFAGEFARRDGSRGVGARATAPWSPRRAVRSNWPWSRAGAPCAGRRTGRPRRIREPPAARWRRVLRLRERGVGGPGGLDGGGAGAHRGGVRCARSHDVGHPGRVPHRRRRCPARSGRATRPRVPMWPWCTWGRPTSGRPRAGTERRSASPAGRTSWSRRVAAVNPKTVVVVNAAAPVDLPWVDDVAAVVWSWFGGEQMASAVADVLTGAAEPGGRLPTTIPVRLEHSPAHDNFPGENGELRYGEGLFMGYRGYEHRCITPRFPFGHGLSYTEFSYGAPGLSEVTFAQGEVLTVSVPVTNVGQRAGTEVVQCYVAPSAPALAAPAQGAQGLRQGPARTGGVRGGRASTRRPVLRLLGPRPAGPPGINGALRPSRRAGPRPRGVPAGLAHRPRALRRAHRPLLGGHRRADERGSQRPLKFTGRRTQGAAHRTASA